MIHVTLIHQDQDKTIINDSQYVCEKWRIKCPAKICNNQMSLTK